MRDTFALLHNDVHVVGILYNFVQGHDVGVLSAASQHLRLMPPACPRIGSHPVHTKSVITSLINNTLLARQLSHDHIRLALIPPNANPFDGTRTMGASANLEHPDTAKQYCTNGDGERGWTPTRHEHICMLSLC